MQIGPVDLNDVIDEVVADLDDQGAREAVQTMGLPVIEADKAQMYLLFLNLVSNALKFADPDRPVSVVVAARSVGDGYRTITVTDNGVGFDPATAPTLFEPFQRGDDRRTEGSGIGLAVCRRIVERHAGTIRADSAVGMGSTFTIRLPVRQ